MSSRRLSTSFFIFGFFWPFPMISSEVISGTPDFIMVASWRLKTAMSLGLIGLAAPPNSGLGLTRTRVGLMPPRRSSARSRLALLDCCSPFILTPRLSVPSHRNICRVTPARGGGSAPLRAVAALAAVRLMAIWISPPWTGSPAGRGKPES